MMKRVKEGFSLLEVIIAAFVFISTVVGVLSVWTAHSRGIAKARMSLVANELGERAMEECIAARFEHVDKFVTPNPAAVVPVKVHFVIKDRPLSAEFFTIVSVRDLGTEIREVTVRVEWTDSTTTQAGERRGVQFVTELHRKA